MAAGEKIDAQWDWTLIFISWMSMVLASLFATTTVGEARSIGTLIDSNDKVFNKLILCAGFGFSFCGTFTMHYLGMAAYQLNGVVLHYKLYTVVLSLLSCVIFVTYGFYQATSKSVKTRISTTKHHNRIKNVVALSHEVNDVSKTCIQPEMTLEHFLNHHL